MPLTIQQLLDALSQDERAVVITPNRRLAAYLKQQFDAAQCLAGRAAWATPDILPFASFVERCYRALNLRDEKNALPQLLDAAQSRLLWQQVVRASDVSSHLLSVTQTARQVAAAWSVAHAWALLPAMRRSTLFDDAAVFLGWTQRFDALCRQRGVIDAAVLPSCLTQLLQESSHGWPEILPRQLFTAGFDITTPQQQHFMRVCSQRGVSVQTAQSWRERDLTACSRVEFPTEDAELRGCAAWARQRLQANPEQHIAIVMPDLRANRGAIARALTDALQPMQRATSLRTSMADAGGFNISLGLALNEYALVHDALTLIAFAQNRATPFLEVSSLLRSPFIKGAASEMGPRARLDATLREDIAPDISLFALQRKLKRADDERLKRAMTGCQGLLATINGVAGMDLPAPATKPSPRDWSRHFGKVLQAWGFPGDEALDSAAFQVLEKFREALGKLATLDALQPRMRADEALNQLRSIVAETVFQPEQGAAEAPIQVLGILESAGQSFDALWVTGLHEDAWPLAARPNPFIPAGLQRAAGVPEASAAASLALDQHLTEGWLVAATEVVFSHALTGNGSQISEHPRAASALSRNIAASAAALLIGKSLPGNYAQALFSIRQRENILDTPLLALPKPTKLAGGAAVLRDQAACPFRAFARYRLGARTLAVPGAGLDAAERGTLLHHVLSMVWTHLGSHSGLTALHEPALEQLVSKLVQMAIAEAYRKGMDSLNGRFAVIEHARLCRLVGEWLNYERGRAPFEVIACEQSRDVSLAGLSMQLRLDRLDRLGDGTHALIDYKTGVAKISGWLGKRPDEPQLPLYFQTSAHSVSTLAFARVKRGARGKVFGFEGVSATENLLPDVGPIENKHGMEKKGYISWDVLTAEWDTTLNNLARNFIAGDTAVDPKNGSLTCAQCDLQSVCRISELTGSVIADDDNAGDDRRAEAPDA